MKIFNNEKEIVEYLGVSNQYFRDELYNFLGCQGSETFSSEYDISLDKFQYNGFNIETDKKTVEVFVAVVNVDEDSYYEYYCIK